MPVDDPSELAVRDDDFAAGPRPASPADVGELLDRPKPRSRSWARALMEWAVDGQGRFLQGRAALGPAVLAMMLPIVANAIGMALFGYSKNSAAYVAIYLVMTLHRLCEAMWDLIRGRESRRSDWP